MRLHHSISLSMFLLSLPLIAVFSLFFSCASTSTAGSESSGTTVRSITREDLLNDPYFTKIPVMPGELFRVLITDDGYVVKQMDREEDVLRAEDENGDEEQEKKFREYARTFNFKDWSLEGMIVVKINPETREIAQIEYLPGQTPRTWQASKYFQEDVTRFHLTFPEVDDDRPAPIAQYMVRYRWLIKREAGLTDEEAKERARAYLKSQVRHF